MIVLLKRDENANDAVLYTKPIWEDTFTERYIINSEKILIERGVSRDYVAWVIGNVKKHNGIVSVNKEDYE